MDEGKNRRENNEKNKEELFIPLIDGKIEFKFG